MNWYILASVFALLGLVMAFIAWCYNWIECEKQEDSLNDVISWFAYEGVSQTDLKRLREKAYRESQKTKHPPGRIALSFYRAKESGFSLEDILR